MHPDCWSKFDKSDTKGDEKAKEVFERWLALITENKIDTGCDCCNTDICRMGKQEHICCRVYGGFREGKREPHYGCPEKQEQT